MEVTKCVSADGCTFATNCLRNLISPAYHQSYAEFNYDDSEGECYIPVEKKDPDLYEKEGFGYLEELEAEDFI